MAAQQMGVIPPTLEVLSDARVTHDELIWWVSQILVIAIGVVMSSLIIRQFKDIRGKAG